MQADKEACLSGERGPHVLCKQKASPTGAAGAERFQGSATSANSTRLRMGSMRSARTRTLSPRCHSSWRDFAPRPEAEAPALALLTRREGDAPPTRTGGASAGRTDEEAELERREPRAPRPLPGPRLP